jgi:hypothetical protein
MSVRVIYPKGDRGKLDTAWVQDYEESDWAIASRRTFTEYEAAREYAIELAKLHKLKYVGVVPAGCKLHDYLD